MHHRLILTVFLLAPFTLATPTAAADKNATGTIKAFECGDNCYLTIRTKTGSDITALCVAKACLPWNELAAIPQKLIGRHVRVTIGTGQQYDGSGNLMGEFPSFKHVTVLKK